jgi:GNAT superfamily N-acetyltransferase
MTGRLYERAMTRAMALNLIEWMDASLQPFGVHTFRNDSLWQRHPGGSGIYLGAVLIDDQMDTEAIYAAMRDLRELWHGEGFALYDCAATYDLTPVGFSPLEANLWYLRPPSAAPEPRAPGEIVIEVVATVDELVDFERASWLGFEENEATPHEWEPFSWHAPATLYDPGMRYLVARFDGQVAAGVITHATGDMLGIYGLSTRLPFRRRGYAAALVRAAVALRPDLPVCVYPDPVSVPIYTDIGFAPAGKIAMWKS